MSAREVTALDAGQTDATLTLRRLHVDHHVYGEFAIRLTGKSWLLVNDPQEIKALGAEDFASNPTVHADDSHHVVLASHPASGVQRVPLRLKAQSYRFCMDPQDEGGDSMTLLDPEGRQVFSIRAGEECALVDAQAALYTMEHRYGGTGGERTIFMRNQANTAAQAAATTAAARSERSLARLPLRSNPLLPLKAAAPQAREYWSLYLAGSRPSDTNGGFLGYAGPRYVLGQPYCSWGMSFTLRDFWLANAFLAVEKDALTQPFVLGQPLGCEDGHQGSYAIRVANSADPEHPANVFNHRVGSFGQGQPDFQALGDVISYPPAMFALGSVPSFRPGGRVVPGNANESMSHLDPGNTPQNWYSPLALMWVRLLIKDYKGHTFSPDFGTQGGKSWRFPAVRANGAFSSTTGPRPYIAPTGGRPPLVPVLAPAQKPGVPGVPSLAIAFRFFPDQVPPELLRTLGPGQVALFTTPDCTGPAVVSENISMPNFSAASIPQLARLGASFQLGLQTSATGYSGSNYTGTARHLTQLGCKQGGFASMRVETDTVTMVVSSHSCTDCNLTGANFAGTSLKNVNLANSNLNAVDLSGLDLSGADLRSASLQGARLRKSNLDGANLCGAVLSAGPLGGLAATLVGAHLKNTNLYQADLDGADLSGASFYGSRQGSCPQGCDGALPSTCATASHASIYNATFESAYLSNVDMSNVTGEAVDFSRTVMFGVSLSGARLNPNQQAGVGSKFVNAYLHGTDFSQAQLSYADFSGASVEPGSTCNQAKLGTPYAAFPGYLSAVGTGTCSAATPVAPFCVQAIFAAASAFPPTDCTNTCPDGARGNTDARDGNACAAASACTPQSWSRQTAALGNPAVPVSGCQVAPLCGSSAFGNTVNTCW